MKEIIKAHKFFIKESGRYLRDKSIQWKTENYFYIDSPFYWWDFIQRGSKNFWYYPLSLRHKMYYPVAYIKFMWYATFYN